MTKFISLVLLIGTIASAEAAHAADLRVFNDGNGNRITATTLGRTASGSLVVCGDQNDVEYFAGPGSRNVNRPSIVCDSGQHRVVIAPIR